LEIRYEDIREECMTLRASENRIDVIFLADRVGVLNPIVVNKRFCGQVRYIIEIGDNVMPVVWTLEIPCLVDLRREVSEDNDSGLIWSIEDRADEKFKVLCLLVVPVNIIEV
jgi:hypothetical protein